MPTSTSGGASTGGGRTRAVSVFGMESRIGGGPAGGREPAGPATGVHADQLQADGRRAVARSGASPVTAFTAPATCGSSRGRTRVGGEVGPTPGRPTA